MYKIKKNNYIIKKLLNKNNHMRRVVTLVSG